MSVDWDSRYEVPTKIHSGIKTLTLWGDYTDYGGIKVADYPNLQTLEITGEFSEIGLENCPNLERVDASKDINQVYFTKIKNCPKLNVPKVRVNEKYLNQSCMFENSKVEEITVDLRNNSYLQIYKSVFCKAYNLKLFMWKMPEILASILQMEFYTGKQENRMICSFIRRQKIREAYIMFRKI